MKNRSSASAFCVTALNMFVLLYAVAQATALPYKDTSDPGSLQVLRSELLAAKDDQARLDSIKKIAGLGEGEAVKFLLAYFKDLPFPQPSTNPYGDSFRVKTIDVILPMLGKSEREGFLAAVIRREADGLREAAAVGADNKYPGVVWDKALEALRRGGASDETWRDLAATADDRSVPERLRVSVKTCLLLKDVVKDDGAICENVRSIIEKFPVRPTTCFIPYDIFYDDEKRIAYGRSTPYKEKNLEFARWRDSGKRAEYETSKNVLLTYGLVSVREIVAFLRRDDVPKERRDCLAMVAASLLAKMGARMKRDGEQAGEECLLLAKALAQYVDQMDDPGGFSCRYDAEVDLIYFCKKTGIEKFRFSSGRQRMDDLAAARVATSGVGGKSPSEAAVRNSSREPSVEEDKRSAVRAKGFSRQVSRDRRTLKMIWASVFFGCVSLLSCVWFLGGRLTKRTKV